MYLLLATLVSGQAHAFDLGLSNVCTGFPCLQISMGGSGTILPPDWFEKTSEELGGNMNWFRVEVYASSPVYMTVGGYELNERLYSREESTERTSVYYVPAVKEAVVYYESRDERLVLDLVIDGSEKAHF